MQSSSRKKSNSSATNSSDPLQKDQHVYVLPAAESRHFFNSSVAHIFPVYLMSPLVLLSRLFSYSAPRGILFVLSVDGCAAVGSPLPYSSGFNNAKKMYSAGTNNTFDKLKKIICGCLALGIVFMMLRSGGLGSTDSSRTNDDLGSGSSLALDKAVSREVRNQLIKEVSNIQNKAMKDGQLWPPVATLPESHRKRILVTGGAGFVGSNLVDRLMMQGHEVIVLDNMFTGRKKNVQHWIGHPSFQMIVGDVVNPVFVEVDQIYHLACPASPPHYQYNPIKTIKTSTEGTLNMLGLAKRVKARILLT